ncbi:MAG: iron-containing alcohol dehydrogenase [Pseudomonadota bacterium]
MPTLDTLAAFSFATAGEIRFGRGTAPAAVDAARAMGRRCFLVHGKNPDRAGWLLRALQDAGLTVTAFGCTQEPDLPLLDAALASARASRPDLVVALGGGAAIDLAKAVAGLLPAFGPASDYLEVVGKGLPLPAAPLPMIALPSTAGTGAEVTRNAVIGVPAHARKVSLRDRRLIPDLAIVDPALTDGCPRRVTLASGLDALTQIVEPWISARANAMTDALCIKAIPMALAALPMLMQGEDAPARDAMAWVSLAGGLALANAGLGVVHGLAGVIGGETGAPHGAICGALLPQGLAANRAALDPGSRPARRIARLNADLAEALDAADDDGIAALARWATAQGLPRLSAMGVRAVDHRRLAGAARHASSMKANPVDLPLAALTAMLAQAG